MIKTDLLTCTVIVFRCVVLSREFTCLIIIINIISIIIIVINICNNNKRKGYLNEFTIHKIKTPYKDK